MDGKMDGNKPYKKTFTERFGEFFVYSIMALILIVFLSLSYAVTKFALTWAFGS